MVEVLTFRIQQKHIDVVLLFGFSQQLGQLGVRHIL